MTAIVDLTIPAAEFELGHLVVGHPGMYVELERIVPLEEEVLPFFWVSNGSAAEIEAALSSSPEVESVVRLTELDDRILFQLHWSSDIDGFVESLIANDGTILSGSGTHREWRFQLRFPDHDALRGFGKACDGKGIPLEVHSVYNPTPPEAESRMTPEQRRTLRVAHEKGYFEVPRRTTLPELAGHFGVSKQAVSQRLRRGLNSLLLETEL